ncbi:MAG: glycosyltransferase family 2 protein [Hyphomicrobiaceae bacterium]
MRFSVVVPVHNNARQLRDCLSSLCDLAYDKSSFEIIVVDNNSTDDTADVARRFPVTLLHETGFQSSYAARNCAIRAARGELIAFTDSDCTADKNWLAEIDAAGAGHQTAGCFAGEILSAPPATLVERFSDDIGLLRQRGPLSGWHFKPYAQTANAVYRRRVFDEIGLFDPAMKSGGDAAIAWRMLDNTAYTLEFVPSAIVYHHHRTSVPELWKQFRRYGTGKMSWAMAQPDYTPPAIARLEADAVAALETAVAALEGADLDEKAAVYPVLRAATQMAHLSGYLQDLLTTLSRGMPLDDIPAHARTLAPRCNICGATAFVPGPNNRMVAGRAPQCAECHSLERHRALAGLIESWRADDLPERTLLSFGEALPPRLAAKFRSARAARIGDTGLGRHDVVVVPSFATLARGRRLPDTLGAIVEPLKDDGTLILIEREDSNIELGDGGPERQILAVNQRLRDLIAEHLPNVSVFDLATTDAETATDLRIIQASPRKSSSRLASSIQSREATHATPLA